MRLTTTVINIYRFNQRRLCDVYIGRPSIFGNPFIIGKDGTREDVIAKYREWIKTQPELLAKIPDLRGKILGCYCKPKACHGDVLAEMADAMPERQ